MIYKDGTDEVIERRKARLGISGDVYVYNDHFIESLETHKKLIPTSTATTIEEALQEREEYEAELERKRAEEAAERAAAEEQEEIDNGENE